MASIALPPSPIPAMSMALIMSSYVAGSRVGRFAQAVALSPSEAPIPTGSSGLSAISNSC